MELYDLLIHEIAFVSVDHVGIEFAVLFFRTWVSLVVADSRSTAAIETEGNFLYFIVTTVAAFEYSLSCSDSSLTGGGDDTWDADEPADLVTMKLTEHSWYLLRVDLDLPFGSFLHIRIRGIEVISLVNSFNGGFEDLDVLDWVFSEAGHQVVIESCEVLHVDFYRVIAPPSIIFELFTINMSISIGGLSDEMHKFQLNFCKG